MFGRVPAAASVASWVSGTSEDPHGVRSEAGVKYGQGLCLTT